MLDQRVTRRAAVIHSRNRSFTESTGAHPELESAPYSSHLAPAEHVPPDIVLRSPEPGDMGWIVQIHGAVYAEEYGFDHRIEAMAAELVAGFLRTRDPAWDRCWIAERDGVRIGSVFVMKETEETARLRMLMVAPAARGLGLGRLLVRECIRFARAVTYRRLTLWTVDQLTTARNIYQAEGFQLMTRARTSDFGPEMSEEIWELALAPSSVQATDSSDMDDNGHR